MNTDFLRLVIAVVFLSCDKYIQVGDFWTTFMLLSLKANLFYLAGVL